MITIGSWFLPYIRNVHLRVEIKGIRSLENPPNYLFTKGTMPKKIRLFPKSVVLLLEILFFIKCASSFPSKAKALDGIDVYYQLSIVLKPIK